MDRNDICELFHTQKYGYIGTTCINICPTFWGKNIDF